VSGEYQPTSDPDVLIEAQGPGWVRYRQRDGRRWETHGVCDKRGNCLVGAVIEDEAVIFIDRARELAVDYAGLDCPVTPDFTGCCPFTFVQLAPCTPGEGFQ
jgi:hypothetical protein